VIADGFARTCYDDGNPATVEQTGWRPLLTTPNHPDTLARTPQLRRRWPRCSAPSSARTRSISISAGSIPPGRWDFDAVRHFGHA